MNQATDEQIIEWIKSHRFSDLTFLNDCWKESNNEKYIGFYYFINEIKNEDIEEIWVEIVNRNKNEAGAYFYLGLIANEIFNSFDKYHISEFFYRKSMELDNSNSEVLWKLYRVTRNNDKLALKSILIDFEYSRYNEIERKLYNIYPCFSEHSGFSQSDWLMLKNILLDENVKLTKNSSILISAYFNLHEFDKGVDLINNEDSLSFDVIKPFYDKGLVDVTKVANKIYDWQYGDLFLNDHKSIYRGNLLLFKKNVNPTVGRMIQFAFKAEEYTDVIRFFQEEASEDPFFLHDKASRLYYLLSKLFINEEMDNEVFNYINDCSNHLIDEEKTLYKFLTIKLQIKKIALTILSENISYNIESNSMYKVATKLLDNKDVYQHYLFQYVNNELISLKDKWSQIYKKKNLDELRSDLDKEDIDYDRFLRLLNLLIDAGDYQFAIEKITEYHDKFQPTMSTYHCIGVCYEKNEEIDNAYKYYEYALDLMLESKEYDFILISNYINAFEKSKGKKLDEDEYNNLRHICNLSLANNFKWGLFTSKNRNTLFKYQPFNINTIDSIINKYFYLASKEQLNDPIEMGVVD